MTESQVILPDMTGAYAIFLPDEAATLALGRRLAALLAPGDFVALWGDLGMGKSTLARALIQHRQQEAGLTPEDVPSPTFTLVQTYEAGDLLLWHFDFYRIAAPEEVYELGLDEALDEGAVLAEWPARLDELLPEERLDIGLESGRKGRTAYLKGTGTWPERLAACLNEQGQGAHES